MNRILCALVFLCGMTACGKKEEMAAPIIAKAYREYIIPKGEHYAAGNNFGVLNKKSIHFKVRFDSSCIYTSQSAANAFDINKLYGFSDCGSHHQANSARYGWLWNGKAIELYAYCYNDGKRESKLLAAVGIGQEVELWLDAEQDKYVFTVGSKKELMDRTCTSGEGESYQLFPYFGGDEVAPHDVRVFIMDL